MFWRSDSNSKGVLPTAHDLRPKFLRPVSGFVSALFSSNSEKSETQETGSTGFGFGRKGEKTAGLKGRSLFFLFLFVMLFI